MKKINLVFLAVLLVAAVVLGACGGSTPSAEPETMSFTSGNYKMDITQESARVAFTPKDGDTYTLYVMVGGTWQKQSSGTVTAKEDGSFTFTPSKEGIPPFTASLEGSTLAVTSTITLDNGDELPGLSLDEEGSGTTTIPIYTSYAEAWAANASRGHNDNLDEALILVHQIPSYARLRINENAPTKSYGGYDNNAIFSAVGAAVGDYIKWDVEYNDHRLLLSRVKMNSYVGTGGSTSLINEVLIHRPINGTDYTNAVAQIQHYAGDMDNDIAIDSAINTINFFEFTVNDLEPLDNLGGLEGFRVMNACNKVWQPGDYFKWKVTYTNKTENTSDDASWYMNVFIVSTNSSGKVSSVNSNIYK
jgi:hypothetical protein